MTRSLFFILFAGLIGIPLVLFTLKKSRRKRSSITSSINQVVFFPNRPTLKRTVDSVNVLVQILRKADQKIDLCVYCLSSQKLIDILIDAHQRQVVIRVITDCEQEAVAGGQVTRLRQSGIQVRIDNSSFLMHHKFCIIDGKYLINGSLNWTSQGIYGNQENVIITDNICFVEPFLKHFNELWNTYDPQNLTYP